jgi:hypothetical protein
MGRGGGGWWEVTFILLGGLNTTQVFLELCLEWCPCSVDEDVCSFWTLRWSEHWTTTWIDLFWTVVWRIHHLSRRLQIKLGFCTSVLCGLAYPADKVSVSPLVSLCSWARRPPATDTSRTAVARVANVCVSSFVHFDDEVAGSDRNLVNALYKSHLLKGIQLQLHIQIS